MKTKSLRKEQRVRRTTLNQLGPNLAIVLVATLLTTRATAFSLLGPYTSWMYFTNGYYNEIGGPMNINEGYRWNVPAVTYGFDKSFLDYFGSNGVAAVESAIQILNDLPPASSIVLSNYPFQSQRTNYQAQSQNLYDLKSITLSLLIEHMGLGQPTRNIFDLRSWLNPVVFQGRPGDEYDWQPWFIPEFIIERNFDPQTLAPTHYVNNTLYAGYVIYAQGFSDVWEYPIIPFPFANTYTAVADNSSDNWNYSCGECNYPDYTSIGAGRFFTGLTWDDVGGLRYLYSTNTVNFETLLPGVRGRSGNSASWVDGAWRPGVDKIVFVRHPVDSVTGEFLTTTNPFIDSFITNGIAMHQQVERVINQPDFLFIAGDLGENTFWTLSYKRTDTSAWINNAALNGGATNAGPGVIQPQVNITFHKLGSTVFSTDDYLQGGDSFTAWASFDATNPVVIYPISGQGNTNELTILFRLFMGNPGVPLGHFAWQLPVLGNANALLQTSTDLLDWMTVDVETNLGSVIEWQHVSGSSPQRFFRVVPQ